MIYQDPFTDFIAEAKTEYPTANFNFLEHAVYTETITTADRYNYLRLLDFARTRQTKNPLFEPIYHQLLHLYVLNGSRLDVLTMLDRRIRGVVEGQAALVLISGSAGMGKTSLVFALQKRIQQMGAHMIVARCSEQESTTYAMWQDMARAGAATGMSLETLLAPIGTGREAQSSQQLKYALADWLSIYTTKQPLVILLDDLHWADADSLEMLNHLSSDPTAAPVLFIATYRSEETQTHRPLDDFLPKLWRNRQVDLIQLNPLNEADVERLVTAYHGLCSTELAAYLYERAEGHPLFTVELLNDLIVQDLLTQDENGRYLPPTKSVSTPTFLKQLIMRRINRLGENVEQLLSIGSVVGESWSLKIIEPLVTLSEDDLLQALENALRAEILVIEDDKAEIYRFSHGLIREVLYTNQLARRRRQLQEQIAAQFEQQQPTNVFAIAYHFIEAEQWAKATNYCLLAGEQAVLRFANHSALRWYQQALNAAERVGNAIDPTIHLAIYDHLGKAHQVLEQRDEAEIVYSRMRDVAQSIGDLIAEGLALVSLAYVRLSQYQFDLSEKTALKALKIGQQTSDLRLLSRIHACLGILQIYRGHLKQAVNHLNEAMSHAQMLEDDFAIGSELFKQHSYLALFTGGYREAEAFALRSLENAEKSTNPLVKVSGYQNLGWSQIEMGKYTDAYQNLNKVIEVGEISEAHHHSLPRLLNLMGYLHLELGAAQEALVWDKKALDASWNSQTQGNYEMRRYSLLNIATDYLYLGKLDEAQDTVAQFEAIKEATESVRFRYFNRYQLLMCQLYLVQNIPKQAIELAQDARQLAQVNGILKNIAKSHWFEAQALASLGQFIGAMEHLEKAISIADEIRHGSLRWKIRLSQAKVQRMAGKSSELTIQKARKMIYHTSQSLSGSPLQALFHSSNWFKQLTELEEEPTPKTPAYPAGLTSREVEVLRLVAKGATNQQVADALHISVRTVNTHMTNILNKTNCENRTAASAFAIQHHLLST